jgi:hypothetical protein
VAVWAEECAGIRDDHSTLSHIVRLHLPLTVSEGMAPGPSGKGTRRRLEVMVQSAIPADVAAQLAREEAPGRSETGVPNDVHDGGPSTMTIRQIVARVGAGGPVGVITGYFLYCMAHYAEAVNTGFLRRTVCCRFA